MARIVGAPKVATGLSEAREAAGAIAEPRIARVCNANSGRENAMHFSLFFAKQKATLKKIQKSTCVLVINYYIEDFCDLCYFKG